MLELLKELSMKVEQAEKTAHCTIDKWNNQIIVSFEKGPEVQIALLTPYQQSQLKKGTLDIESISELLFSVRKIANWSVCNEH